MTAAICPPSHLTCVDLVTTGGEELTVTDGAALFPYLTRQMVTLDSLVPGSRILVWMDARGAAAKVMLFVYGYRGYISWEPTGEVSVNGRRLPVTGRVVDGEVLLPIRAVAEAAGVTEFPDACCFESGADCLPAWDLVSLLDLFPVY